MAKSAGNIERVAELPARGIDPLAFRYLCLTSRYRHTLEYTTASLDAAAAGLGSLRAGLRGLGPPPDDGSWTAPTTIHAGRAPDRPIGTVSGLAGHGATWAGSESGGPLADRAADPAARLSGPGRELHDRFVAAIDDDLDLPTALAVTREALRGPLPADERRWLVLDFDAILGLDLDRVWDAPQAVPTASADVEGLLAERTAARAARDFARADAIRDELAGQGWVVVDGPDGSTLRPSAGG
jgi:cysteinyl-tRNA synthetase